MMAILILGFASTVALGVPIAFAIGGMAVIGLFSNNRKVQRLALASLNLACRKPSFGPYTTETDAPPPEPFAFAVVLAITV
jgi:hypothetical protein